MRVLALAEESLARGWRVHVVGDMSGTAIDALEAAVPGAQVTAVAREIAAGELMRIAVAESADVVHLDTYWGDFDALYGHGWILSNMQDGPFGVRRSDVAIDANIGAEAGFVKAPAGGSAIQLVGGRAAVTRRQVRRHVHTVRELDRDAPRRVLVVIGGTDPAGLTPRIIEHLDAVRVELEVTVVSTSGGDAVRDAARKSDHAVRVIRFVADLPALAVANDLVISAAGTSILDFACMGIPMALVGVADNQLIGYERATSAGIALALGFPPDDEIQGHLHDLEQVLESPAELRRLSRLGRGAVDGLGTWRITGAWEAALTGRGRVVPPSLEGAWVSREASVDDARLLFEWRNDEETRRRSRTAEPVAWEAHVEWLSRSIASAERRLLIVEHEDRQVGTVRWDRTGPQRWEVSITVAPHERGRGLAANILAMGERALADQSPVTLAAVIHEENEASLRLFSAAGYTPDLPADEDGFLTFAKQRN
jgi:RimJ/RimL family protein N-acetyltransferase